MDGTLLSTVVSQWWVITSYAAILMLIPGPTLFSLFVTARNDPYAGLKTTITGSAIYPVLVGAAYLIVLLSVQVLRILIPCFLVILLVTVTTVLVGIIRAMIGYAKDIQDPVRSNELILQKNVSVMGPYQYGFTTMAFNPYLWTLFLAFLLGPTNILPTSFASAHYSNWVSIPSIVCVESLGPMLPFVISYTLFGYLFYHSQHRFNKVTLFWMYFITGIWLTLIWIGIILKLIVGLYFIDPTTHLVLFPYAMNGYLFHGIPIIGQVF